MFASRLSIPQCGAHFIALDPASDMRSARMIDGLNDSYEEDYDSHEGEY